MESKIAVIYKSKYGSTKRYAGWIALKLNADLYEASDIGGRDLNEYRTIIYGGPLYIGKIKGINFINKNYESIKDKSIILFMVGINNASEEYTQTILENNIDKDMRDNIKTFWFKGDLNYQELGFVDKILIKGLQKGIYSKDKRTLSEEDKLILKLCDEPINLCDKKSINDLVSSISVENTKE